MLKAKTCICVIFLSRIQVDEGNPHQLKPILFCITDILMSCYDHLYCYSSNDLMVTTRSAAKATGTVLPKVHGVHGTWYMELDPFLHPERDP